MQRHTTWKFDMFLGVRLVTVSWLVFRYFLLSMTPWTGQQSLLWHQWWQLCPVTSQRWGHRECWGRVTCRTRATILLKCSQISATIFISCRLSLNLSNVMNCCDSMPYMYCIEPKMQQLYYRNALWKYVELTVLTPYFLYPRFLLYSFMLLKVIHYVL